LRDSFVLTAYRWEHTLDEQAVIWLWDFCNAKREVLVNKARALQPTACEIVRQGFSQAESGELHLQGHMFSRHFRVDSPQISPTGPLALVAAADQVRADTPQRAIEFTQHHPAVDTRPEQQSTSDAADIGSVHQQSDPQSILRQWQLTTAPRWPQETAGQTASFGGAASNGDDPKISTDEQAAFCRLESRFTSGLTAYDDDATTAPAQAFVLQQVGNEQNAQHLWRPRADASWSAQDAPLNSAITPTFNRLNDAETSMTEDNSDPLTQAWLNDLFGNGNLFGDFVQ
jgi:hypothetical protein